MASQVLFQSQDPPPTMELAVAVLRDLLRYAAQLPTLFRDISMNHLPGLLTSLLGLRPEVRLSCFPSVGLGRGKGRGMVGVGALRLGLGAVASRSAWPIV